jgi:hypothetical protein
MQPKSFTASNSNISKVLKVEKKLVSFYYFFLSDIPIFWLKPVLREVGDR